MIESNERTKVSSFSDQTINEFIGFNKRLENFAPELIMHLTFVLHLTLRKLNWER